jgi:transcriptional regulator of arginine metabolism
MNGVKDKRQRAILDLVRSGRARTQQDLASALGGLGLGATQATVSRDIQELGLVRTGDGYRLPNAGHGLVEHVLSVTVVQFIAVVKTPPGAAHLVARALDEGELEGVAGTVAGDDTVIVVLDDGSHADSLRGILQGA